jgi:hypothetical protein
MSETTVLQKRLRKQRDLFEKWATKRRTAMAMYDSRIAEPLIHEACTRLREIQETCWRIEMEMTPEEILAEYGFPRDEVYPIGCVEPFFNYSTTVFRRCPTAGCWRARGPCTFPVIP